jgi:hypothetical protein
LNDHTARRLDNVDKKRDSPARISGVSGQVSVDIVPLLLPTHDDSSPTTLFPLNRPTI